MSLTYLVSLNKEQVAEGWLHLSAKMAETPQTWDGNSPEEILADINSGAKQLWALCTSDMVAEVMLLTDVRDEPWGRILRVSGAWGQNMDRYLPLIGAQLPELHRHMGIDFFEVSGRPGWVKKLRSLGFTLERVTVLKRMNGLH